MAFKMTTDRLEALRLVESAVETGLGPVVEDLERLLEAVCDEVPPHLAALPEALLRYLKCLLQRLKELDDRAFRLENEQRARRREVRQAFLALRRHLIDLRDLLRHAYDEDDAQLLMLGVPRRVPRYVVAGLVRMTRVAIRQLGDPDLDVSVKDEYRPHLPERFARDKHAAQLREKVVHLRLANRRLKQTSALLQGTYAKKEVATEEYNAAFPDAAKIFECLFRLSGHPEHTDSLKPSGQEKGLLLSQVTRRRAIRAGIKAGKERRAVEATPAEETPPDADDSS